jgi:microcystin-dependent protein
MSDGFPIGAIIAFPGDQGPPSKDYWALCDGSTCPITGSYAQLFAVIGFASGGSQESGKFYLPDYRGRFLRGTSYDTGYDPDAATRTSMNVGGNKGDAISSVQPYDTSWPSTSFTIELPHLPVSSRESAATLIGSNVSRWNSGSKNITFGGGDSETRPPNAYVDFYIKYADDGL